MPLVLILFAVELHFREKEEEKEEGGGEEKKIYIYLSPMSRVPSKSFRAHLLPGSDGG